MIGTRAVSEVFRGRFGWYVTCGVAAVLSVGLFAKPAHLPTREPFPGMRGAKLKKALRADRKHTRLSYSDAREAMFQKVDKRRGKVEGIYSGKEIEAGEGTPPFHRMQTEHAWAVTRLARPTAMSDLHHMYPVTPFAKGLRFNLHYGTVDDVQWSTGGSKRGFDKHGDPKFEPRKLKRGDLARSLFYVSVMYRLSIPSHEEAELKRWHLEDPVSDEERARNQAIAKLQTSRNPFVDYPQLVKRIDNF